MNRMRNDDRASVIGLPLDLMVIAVVIAVSVPSVWYLSGMYARSQVRNDLENDLEHIDDLMEDMSDGDPGEQRKVTIDINDNPLTSVGYIEAGGMSISDMMTVKYSIDGGRERRFVFDEGGLTNHTECRDMIFSLPSDGDTFIIKNSGERIQGKPIFEVRFSED
ncbi:MAG: hypothetical protein ACQESD_02995 [Thermoplasmatota archaeon]